MKLGIDDYAQLESPIHQWLPKYKLIGLTALILAFSFVQKLALLPLMAVTTAMFYQTARLPFKFWRQRLQIPGTFLAVLLLLLPFMAGETVLAEIGPLNIYREGLLAVVQISVRFVCILTLGLVLFGTAPFFESIRAMRSLGLPPILADMTLLTYRYIFEIGDYFQSMRTAMKLRGFESHRLNWQTLKHLAALAGSLIVRSYEKSEQVYKAMLLRGYGQNMTVIYQPKPTRRDSVLLSLTLGLAAGILLAEVF
ncbi:MAG: cobalt ECF transporter T component CbiQ [Leptolyngbyaceae cyanobacterium SM1_1_3]|nr:cobalt ECF transporter T component CbiQ [Leptolyngbyaceae cyanobacterium SM1_1_3]NJN02111.1 cobalt ECF transporter T component CbiQ [Leptolyngbyaceae cyanobacterium RM1_1_2]NJO09719.1 cobalt ECF transporter T component CbiQ [Leptolyngbyaceae cyanobacterium SL_1_1]